MVDVVNRIVNFVDLLTTDICNDYIQKTLNDFYHFCQSNIYIR